jgi:hypothetical protein
VVRVVGSGAGGRGGLLRVAEQHLLRQLAQLAVRRVAVVIVISAALRTDGIGGVRQLLALLALALALRLGACLPQVKSWTFSRIWSARVPTRSSCFARCHASHGVAAAAAPAPPSTSSTVRNGTKSASAAAA